MRKHLLANYLGDVWLILIQFAIIPVYVHFLGVEAYGILAFHATLTALAGIASLGISPVLTREVSRRTGTPGGDTSIRSFVLSIGSLYLGVCVTFTVLAISFLRAQAIDWINPQNLGSTDLDLVFLLMFIQIGIQLGIGFAMAVLQGMQKHVTMNVIGAAGMTLRLAGAAVIVGLFSTRLDVLFAWMITATAMHFVPMAFAASRALPDGPWAFAFRHVMQIWRAAGILTLTIIVSLILVQIDKVIVSRALPLSEFGVYALAASVAALASRPIAPLSRTFLPRFTQLVGQGRPDELARLYHLGSQLASVLIIPLAVTLAIFAPTILTVVFGPDSDALDGAPIVALLSIGLAGLGLMALPYMLTLAEGWPQFGFYQNVVACCAVVPAMITLVHWYGAVGCAIAWVCLGLGFVVISPFFIHSRCLPGACADWYRYDVVPAVIASLAVALLLREIAPFSDHRIANFFILGGIYAATLAAALASLSSLRSHAWNFLHAFAQGKHQEND
ncbi:MAG: oligosaccharide flippase family protein [Pseudomonadota bacterium]